MGNEQEIHTSIQEAAPPPSRSAHVVAAVRDRLIRMQFSFAAAITPEALVRLIREEEGGIGVYKMLMQQLGNMDDPELLLMALRNEVSSYEEVLASLSPENPCRPEFYRQYQGLKEQIRGLTSDDAQILGE